MKKTVSLLTFLLLSATTSNYGMKREREEQQEEKVLIPTGSRILLPSGEWVLVVGNVLLDKAQVRDLVQFTDLPPEILEQIIVLLSATTAARSVEEFARNLSSLASVNKQLNALINDSQFCLQLIHHLAKKFSQSSDEIEILYADDDIAKILKTKEAKRRFYLQMKLWSLCGIKYETATIKQFEQILQDGATLNFTYNTNFHIWLQFSTPLIEMTKNKNLELITLFLNNKANVNQQDSSGKTALMWLDYSWRYNILDKDVTIAEILLNAGADPEIINKNGDSALTIIQKAVNNLQLLYDEAIEAQWENYNLPDILEQIERGKKIIAMFEDAIQKNKEYNEK